MKTLLQKKACAYDATLDCLLASIKLLELVEETPISKAVLSVLRTQRKYAIKAFTKQ